MTDQDRTTGPTPDTPDEPEESLPVPWARQPHPPRQRSTSRVRQIVEGLPDWEPMPPAVAVRRPQQG